MLATLAITPETNTGAGPEIGLSFILLGATGVMAWGLWRSVAEMTKGAMLFERRHDLLRVRLDGSPMRWRDWWQRHWMSLFLIVALILLVFAPALPKVRGLPFDIRHRWTWAFWGRALLLVGVPVGMGYAYCRLRPTTKLVRVPSRKLLGGRRGFDVVPVQRGGDAEAVEELETPDPIR